jgi:hypothetical protein
MAAEISLAQANKDKVEGVVCRLAMPAPVRGMDKMVTYLEKGYGQELFMYQDGDWLVITTKQA